MTEFNILSLWVELIPHDSKPEFPSHMVGLSGLSNYPESLLLAQAIYNPNTRQLRSIKPTVCMHVLSLSHVQLFSTTWTVACQAPLSMGFPRKKYWSGLQFPSPGELPNPGIKPASSESLIWQVDSLLVSHLGSP